MDNGAYLDLSHAVDSLLAKSAEFGAKLVDGTSAQGAAVDENLSAYWATQYALAKRQKMRNFAVAVLALAKSGEHIAEHAATHVHMTSKYMLALGNCKFCIYSFEHIPVDSRAVISVSLSRQIHIHKFLGWRARSAGLQRAGNGAPLSYLNTHNMIERA